jgi:hypothetical protein
VKNPIVRFAVAFFILATVILALVITVGEGLYDLALFIGGVATAALLWAVVTVFQAVDYDPDTAEVPRYEPE